MRKKLMIVLPTLEGGGAQRVMVTLARNINKQKFEVFLLAIDGTGPYRKNIPESVNLIDLKIKRVRYSAKKIITTVNEVKPDLLLSTLGYLSILILAIRKYFECNPKIIIRISNTPSQKLKKYSLLKQFTLKKLINYFYSKADIIVNQCREMEEDFHNTFNITDNKTTYIYNPIDLKSINQTITGNNPYDQETINFLAVGRLTYQKGFDILLKSFELVLKKYPNARLTILGKGEMEEDLTRLIEELQITKNVRMLGFVDNPFDYYYYSDVFVLSSRWEGFPNAMLEALACGTKVVSTNCKSGPTEILRNNEFGELAEVNNYINLSSQMIKSLESSNKSSNRAGDFNVSKIIKDYERLFMDI